MRYVHIKTTVHGLIYSTSMARSKGCTFYMNAMSTNKLSDTYHQLYKKEKCIYYFCFEMFVTFHVCTCIVIISFLLSVQNKIKYNL